MGQLEGSFVSGAEVAGSLCHVVTCCPCSQCGTHPSPTALGTAEVLRAGGKLGFVSASPATLVAEKGTAEGKLAGGHQPGCRLLPDSVKTQGQAKRLTLVCGRPGRLFPRDICRPGGFSGGWCHPAEIPDFNSGSPRSPAVTCAHRGPVAAPGTRMA